jgi:hypothetical protein
MSKIIELAQSFTESFEIKEEKEKKEIKDWIEGRSKCEGGFIKDQFTIERLFKILGFYGDYQRIEFLCENGYKNRLRHSTWHSLVSGSGEDYDVLETFNYLKVNTVSRPSSKTCTFEAANNRLRCLEWLRENGCNWNSNTCRYAAEKGHVKCLAYALKNGCPHNDVSICRKAKLFGHTECLELSIEHGCPYDDDNSSVVSRSSELSWETVEVIYI